MKNQVFFPQAMLDVLVELGRMDLEGDELVLGDGGYRYKLEEGVRIIREVTTGEDPSRLCGKVRSRASLAEELGAELLGGSMLIEDSAYDVVPGFLGEPAGEAAEEAKPELAVLMELQRAADE
jgi:hypothetical protein